MAVFAILIGDYLRNNLQSICVLSGIAVSNTPALILRAQPGELLYQFRTLWPFKSVRVNTLDSCLSFSPRNLKEGKWYTLLTSLFNHTGTGHFLGNFIILFSAAPSVIKSIGVGHFLSLYLGGGVVGNLVLFIEYIIQRSLWKGTLPDYSSSWFFGSYVESVKTSSMTTIYNAVNEWRPIIGASGCVSAVIGYNCVSQAFRLCHYLKRAKHAREGEVVLYRGPKFTILADAGIIILKDALQIGYALTQFKHDFGFFVRDLKTSSQGVLNGAFAYSSDGVGHGSHFGGFLFGVAYYFFVHYVIRHSFHSWYITSFCNN